MKELFYELLKEASLGKVKLNDQVWPISFNSIIYENDRVKISYINEQNITTLVIRNEDEFFNLLDKYMKLEQKRNRKTIPFLEDKEKMKEKLYMAYLFVNATTEDFLKPKELLERNIAFLEDHTFQDLDQGVLLDLRDTILDSNLKIMNKEQSVLMETPQRLEFSFVKVENGKTLRYLLPSISYGICEKDGKKECYIYSILNPKQKFNSKEEETFGKKVTRKLYKINKDVDKKESVEYHDYMAGKDSYFPENISLVSPSAVFVLACFLSFLEQKQITRVKAVPYLPLRYLSRDIAASQVDESLKEKLIARNNAIQTNITDKFIRTFRRVSYHLPSVHIITYPYEVDEFLTVELDPMKKKDSLSEVTDNLNLQQHK